MGRRTAALLALLSVVFPTSARATAPGILWSVPVVKRMMIPGQVGYEIITFKSNSNASDVDVTSTPTLRPYVFVFPQHFSHIAAGRSYSLLIGVAIPSKTLVGTMLNGAVTLATDRSSPISSLSIVLDVEAASARSPDPGKIVQDLGARYVANEVVFRLSRPSTIIDAARIAARINGSVVGIIPELDMYQVLLNGSSPAELTQVISYLRSGVFSLITGVTRSYLAASPIAPSTELDSLAASCTFGPSYTAAYDSVNVRRAWDLIRIVGPTQSTVKTVVGILDTGVQLIVGQTPTLGTILHPEFTSPTVDFGTTPPESRIDSAFDVSDPRKGGHGTQVAGIIGANNRLDVGLPYQCPSMNGVLSGIPGISTKYTLEERIGPATSFPNQLANSLAIISQGKARIVLDELEISARDRLSPEQLNTGSDCDFSAFSDINDLETLYQSWFDHFNAHPDVLFVLPAGNYNQELPFLNRADLRDQAVSLVGGINLSNTVTVGAFDPSQGTRAVWKTLPSGVTCYASNYGPGVEIAAPGTHVYAPKPTEPTHLNPIDFYTSAFQGTSAAAPFVAGAAAMILATVPQQLSPTDLKRILSQAPPNGGADTFPASLSIGTRLNVCRSLRHVLGWPTFALNSSNPANGSNSISVDKPILLNFGAPVDAQQIASTLQVFASNNPQPLNGTVLGLNQQSVEFIPAQALQPGIAYLVDLRNVTDICGDRLSGSTAVTFVTSQTTTVGPQFDFAVDFLSVVGNVNSGAGFVDDFNDGSLTTPPTSNIVCNQNIAPVSESGGFLHLSSADGANTFSPGSLVDNCILGQDATSFRLNDGSGNSVITASFRADVPGPGQGAGLQLFTFGTNEIVNINFSTGPFVVAVANPASGPQSVQAVPIDLTGIQRVMLRLTFNDSTNQVTHSYSLNGGATFIDIPLPQPGRVMTSGSQAVVSVFGSVQLPSSP